MVPRNEQIPVDKDLLLEWTRRVNDLWARGHWTRVFGFAYLSVGLSWSGTISLFGITWFFVFGILSMHLEYIYVQRTLKEVDKEIKSLLGASINRQINIQASSCGQSLPHSLLEGETPSIDELYRMRDETETALMEFWETQKGAGAELAELETEGAATSDAVSHAVHYLRKEVAKFAYQQRIMEEAVAGMIGRSEDEFASQDHIEQWLNGVAVSLGAIKSLGKESMPEAAKKLAETHRQALHRQMRQIQEVIPHFAEIEAKREAKKRAEKQLAVDYDYP